MTRERGRLLMGKAEAAAATANQAASELRTAKGRLLRTARMKMKMNRVLMAIPRGMARAASAVNATPRVRATKRKETTMLEGRFTMSPPARLPSFSPARVARLIQVPAVRKESATRIASSPVSMP